MSATCGTMERCYVFVFAFGLEYPIRSQIYDNKRVFNEKVLELRDHKVHLVSEMKHIGERLVEIRGEIPAKMVRHPPAVPTIDDELEFPEKNLEVR